MNWLQGALIVGTVVGGSVILLGWMVASVLIAEAIERRWGIPGLLPSIILTLTPLLVALFFIGASL